MKCGTPTQAPKDLFCGNYGSSRQGWRICRKSWHSRCYGARSNLKFHVAQPENDEGGKWVKKKDEERFLVARNGDMISAPFQCDCCWFVNLSKREPSNASESDHRLLGYIRRVNLDMFWSSEGSTVGHSLGNLRKAARMSTLLNLAPHHVPRGPWPVGDNLGFQVAIEMVRASQEKGRNSVEYVQFDTVRKIRSCYTNAYESSPAAVLELISFKGDFGKTYHFSKSPLNSLLFRKFMMGLEKRMGRLVYQDLALSTELLMEVLDRYDLELDSPGVAWSRRREIVMSGAAFVILFAGALRGGEVLLLEASELCKRIRDGKHHSKEPHVLVPLMGRFKGETGERNVLLAFCNVTLNGKIPIRKWIERLAAVLMHEGRQLDVGPALCNQDGYVMHQSDLNKQLWERLQNIQATKPELFARDLDIENKYKVFRSFRRGATTRAKEFKVGEDILNMNNRWRKVQNKSGTMPNLPMSDLYTEIQQALLTRLRFSKSL